METSSLRRFVTLAETLNFRAAAQRLHLSQPSLTRSIAAMEQTLGVRLFDRDSTRVALTAHGAQLLPHARAAVEAADEFTAVAHRIRPSAHRTLKLGIFSNGLAELTDVVIREYQQRFPEVELQVRDVEFTSGIQPVLSGELDVGMVQAPAPVAELRITPVFTEPIDAVVPADHPLAGRSSISVTELFADLWVTLPPSVPASWLEVWLVLAKRGGVWPAVEVYARSAADFFAAIAYQHCVGLAPRSGLRTFRQPGVAAVPLSDVGPTTAAVIEPADRLSLDARELGSLAVALARAHPDLVPDSQVP